MIRRIIEINQDLCNGCGACADACHEGAIGMVNGKATLLRDDYCDGLGDCLPHCPADAIKFIDKDTVAYDEAAVEIHKKKKQEEAGKVEVNEPCGCPGSRARAIVHETENCQVNAQAALNYHPQSRLSNWPVQIKLAPVKSAYFDHADLLIAADCTAYAYAAFHDDFIKSRVTLIGCPKLDDVQYADKLTQIIANNEIKSVTIVRMEVPCCGGLEYAAKTALQASGKFLPWQVVTISTDGKILD